VSVVYSTPLSHFLSRLFPLIPTSLNGTTSQKHKHLLLCSTGRNVIASILPLLSPETQLAASTDSDVHTDDIQIILQCEAGFEEQLSFQSDDGNSGVSTLELPQAGMILVICGAGLHSMKKSWRDHKRIPMVKPLPVK